MQVTCGFPAQKSPCHSCQSRQPEYECASQCDDLNGYLVRIGDLPHKPPEKIPLHKVYKVKRYGPKECCTPEQFQEIRASLILLRTKIRMTLDNMARSIGIPMGSIDSIIYGKQKRMDIVKYGLVTAWVEKYMTIDNQSELVR